MTSHLLRFALVTTFVAAPTASAHFAFLLPDAGGRHGQLVLSEDLAADPAIPGTLLAGAKLTATDSDGHAAAVTVKAGAHAADLDLPLNGPRIFHGTLDAGVMARDPAHPFLVVYYPKAIFGDPYGKRAAAPVELTAIGRPGVTAFRFTTGGGKPVADATVTVIGPDGAATRAATDADGRTRSFATPGRYGAWAKVVDPTAGDVAGRHYAEVRRYATLVVDAPAAVASPLPQAAASFGAITCDGWAYVYGGHVVPTHDYSTASVSGQFHRLHLDGGTVWESLPGGPPLQGMNLATDGRRVYRVGGMQPRNPPGRPADVRSVADAAGYDPTTGRWAALPPLPVPRSSHDVAVIGHTLYVVGGWNLTGHANDAKFATDVVSLDLSKADARWQSGPQPFQRRALTVVAHAGRVYAIGGFTPDGDPSLAVDVLDPATGRWSTGPALPGPADNGFGPAAADVDGDLFVFVGDGSVYRLDGRRHRWELAATVTPRIVGRAVVGAKDQLLVLGGSTGARQSALVEVVPVDGGVVNHALHSGD